MNYEKGAARSVQSPFLALVYFFLKVYNRNIVYKYHYSWEETS